MLLADILFVFQPLGCRCRRETSYLWRISAASQQRALSGLAGHLDYTRTCMHSHVA